jgi:hypothetical protein
MGAGRSQGWETVLVAAATIILVAMILVLVAS